MAVLLRVGASAAFPSREARCVASFRAFELSQRATGVLIGPHEPIAARDGMTFTLNYKLLRVKLNRKT